MEVKIVGLGDRGKILNTSFIPINKILNFQENCRMVVKYLLICLFAYLFCTTLTLDLEEYRKRIKSLDIECLANSIKS